LQNWKVPDPEVAREFESREEAMQDEAQLTVEVVPEGVSIEDRSLSPTANDSKSKNGSDSDGTEDRSLSPTANERTSDSESDEEQDEPDDSAVEAEENDDEEEEDEVGDGNFKDEKRGVVIGPGKEPTTVKISEEEEDDEDSGSESESFEEGSEGEDDEQKSAPDTPSPAGVNSRSVSSNQKVPNCATEESDEDDGNSRIVVALIKDADAESD
jgi:histone acetyltransferase SAS3